MKKPIPVRSSGSCSASASWPELLARTRETEALGFDGLFLVHHFYGLFDVMDPKHEAYRMLASLAPFTQSLRLGALVCEKPKGNPVADPSVEGGRWPRATVGATLRRRPDQAPAARKVSMKRVSMVVSLSVGLIAVSGVASAQKTEGPFILGNIDSTCVTSGAGAGNWTITCGDVAPGAGTTLITPSSVNSGLVPADAAPGPAPASEPAAEPAPVDEAVTDVPAEAVDDTTAAETDTDGDGLLDEEEINVYATDPGVWDTDGDALSDGDELLTTRSDPFIWDTDGDGVADGDEGAAGTDPLVADEPTSDATGVDSDNDRLADADEAAAGTDPSTPDADGDGYYDGDEVNLGSDPLDPANFPEVSESLGSA